MKRTTYDDVRRRVAVYAKIHGRDYTTNAIQGAGIRILDGARDLSPRGTAKEVYVWFDAYVDGWDAGVRHAARD